MKKFSLEEYLKNPDREVVTRDGYPAKIICTNFHLSGYPIVAEINDKKYGNKQSWSFDKNGQFDSCKNNGKDLFFAPEKHTGYINLYCNEGGYFLGRGVNNSEKNAKYIANGDNQYITTIKIEWEE